MHKLASTNKTKIRLVIRGNPKTGITKLVSKGNVQKKLLLVNKQFLINVIHLQIESL